MKITREELTQALEDNPKLFWEAVAIGGEALGVFCEEDIEIVTMVEGPPGTAWHERSHAQFFDKLLQRLRNGFETRAERIESGEELGDDPP